MISTAYERHSVIVTTNLPFENWTEVLAVSVSPVPLWTASLTVATS